jgi:tetratricopeptide (TPR) repeat protein
MGSSREQSLKLLQSVLASKETPYDSRAEAALELASSKAGAQNSGSAELDLLAAGGPDEASAGRPLFYQARVRAAERSGDPAVKIRLLLDALAINPQAEGPRLTLFREAAGAGQAQLAISALQPWLEGESTSYPPRYRRPFAALAQGEGRDEDEERDTSTVSYLSTQFLSRAALDAAQRALLARQVAGAFEKLGRLGGAVTYWEIALRLEPAEASRAELKLKLRSVQSELKRQEADASRRPQVTEHLEQKTMVLPRLVATAGQSGGSRRGDTGR